MTKVKTISDAVIKRLPRYYRCIKDLQAEGVERISSGSLADMLNITASQVRQDFSNFGEFGQQGYGYSVDKLKSEIASILGLDKKHNLIIIGCGNIGKALTRYRGFKDDGFFVKAVFDIDTSAIRNIPDGIEVYNMDKLSEFVSNNVVDIAVITTQADTAITVVNELSKLGVKNIWNFAPIDIASKNPDLVVENINMSDSLFVLSYKSRV